MNRGASGGHGARRLRVCCLPIAGPENPYQHLMMAGLRQDPNLEVLHGAPGKFFAAVRTVIRHRPDVIHYDWIFRYFMRRRRWWTWLNAPLFVFEIWLVRFVFGTRIVWTMHNMGTHDVPLGRVELWVRRRFARTCEWIRVFSDETAKKASDLLRVQPSRFVVVPEGSYVEYYPNLVDRMGARSKLGLATDQFVFLYLGGIRRYKGLETLIPAFKQVAKSDWLLLIAGQPMDADYVRELTQLCDGDPRIKMELGFIPDTDLQYYFNASDLVVLPFTEVENSGSVVLAMGFAKPIIAPDKGVIRSRLYKQSQLLFTNGNLPSVLLGANRLSQSELQEIGLWNYRLVKENGWDRFCRAFNNLAI